LGKSFIYGAGITAGTYVEILKHTSVEQFSALTGLVDENQELWQKEKYGMKVLGGIEALPGLVQEHAIDGFYLALMAVKHIYVKNNIFDKFTSMGLKPLNLISGSSYISFDASLDSGIVIFPGSMIGSGVKIKNNVIIHALVSILEESVLQENCAVASNTFIGARCNIGKNVYIGPGCTIGYGVTVGDDSVVGAGSVVLKDVPSGVLGFGNPFKINGPNKYLP